MARGGLIQLNWWVTALIDQDKKMKTVGKMNCVNILEGSGKLPYACARLYVHVLMDTEGFTLALFTRQLGWSADRVTEYLKDITTELKESKDHLWYGL